MSARRPPRCRGGRVARKPKICGRHGHLYTDLQYFLRLIPFRVIKSRPPRLERIFQSYDPPLFFITFCTLHRERIKALDLAHEAFRTYAFRGRDEFNIAVGRYVIMLDHVHLFVRGGPDFEIAKWVNG